MKKQLRRLIALGLSICLSVALSITAFAGQWIDYEGVGLWQYKNDNGTYARDCWQTIDGKSYHFDIMQFLEQDTLTDDGYMVDENGAWIESIPQKSEAEIEQYWHDYYTKILITAYEVGYATEKELNDLAILSLGEDEGKRIMEEIRNNYVYGSKKDLKE